MKLFLNNITLLLPVYNGGKDFNEILSSLENLNVRTNIIIYNDGSTDDSFRLGCEYAEMSDHKVRLIDGKRNRGYFRSIKILLKICPTDFFIFLGHDDQISNNYLDEFEIITSETNNVACIYTDIATITPEGIVTNTWPNIQNKDSFPNRMTSTQALRTFHKYEWGNLFVGIWSKQVLSYKTLLQIMECVRSSSLKLSLKRLGFLNDNMAVLRALSYSKDNFVIYNKSGVYFKKVDPQRLSEGGLHVIKEKILHNPLGYISTVAYLMLPQIKQKKDASLWALRYIYIYIGITMKLLIRNPSSIDFKMFLQGGELIINGYFYNILWARNHDG